MTILAVNLSEPRATVEAWVTQKAVSFPVLLDPDATVSKAYRISSTPTVYLLDRSGKLVAKAVGTRPWTAAAGRRLLAALLEKP